jgi:hypothetical protein
MQRPTHSSYQINIEKKLFCPCEGRRCGGSFWHVLWVAAARKPKAGLTLIIEITKDVGGYCPQLFSLLQSKLIS